MMAFRDNKKGKLLVIALVLASFFLGFWIANKDKQYCPPEDIDMSLFWEAYYKLQDAFVDSTKFDNQKIIYGAIAGMTNSLEDDYTIFLEPEETKRFNDDVKGSFEGVGMEIGVRDGQLKVIAPLEGTPAQEAGLIAGDDIVMIDGASTYGMSADEASNLIRGEKGTEVALTIYREEWRESREIKIIREVIDIPSLNLVYLNENGEKTEDGNIAWLSLYHFTENAADDFKDTGLEIINHGANKIILDLRNNPGGYLEVSQYIAGWFLEKGAIVVTEDFGNEGMEDIVYKAKGSSLLLGYSVVVLINEGSASASEILAGALRDNLGVKLIGQQSFGKGSVQILEELSEGSSLKITIAKWLTPSGYNIDEVGLTPDYEVEITGEDYKNNRDSQLEKAIEIINQL